MKILIVEDEEKLAKTIQQGLEKNGYTASYVTDGKRAMSRISMSRDDYDLIILDLILPEMTGIEICKAARDLGITTPILMLTALGSEHDKVSALDAGADDYVVKPFSFSELLARIRALLRRPHDVLPQELSANSVTLNTVTRNVTHGGEKLYLTAKEFALLEYFLRNPERVITRDQLIEHLWGDDFDSFSNVVDVHIKNLRKKLKDKDGEIIKTVTGVGFQLKK